MFNIKTGLIAIMILFFTGLTANSKGWQQVGERHGNAIYYSDDGQGYYRKVSEEEIVQKKGPQVYIVVDESGYYYHHLDENGGGGSYSYTMPSGMEEHYDENDEVSNVTYHPKQNAVSYDYKCPCESRRTDKEITNSEVNVSALYPMYFDNH
jgi:hypothetical protein